MHIGWRAQAQSAMASKLQDAAESMTEQLTALEASAAVEVAAKTAAALASRALHADQQAPAGPREGDA